MICRSALCRRASACATVLTLLMALTMLPVVHAGAIKESQDSFPIGRQRISVERFEPAAPGSYPCVIVVHGADGPLVCLIHYRDFARELAAHDYVALLIHYFDRTGTRVSNSHTNVAYFGIWLDTLMDAIVYAAKQPNVATGRLGLWGASLGSYLSLAMAEQQADKIGAVVEFCGGLTNPIAEHAEALPPVFIVHGEADTTIPVREAHKLEELLKQKGIRYEIKTYPGQADAFTGEAERDSIRRAIEFFDKHLKGEAATTPGPR